MATQQPPQANPDAPLYGAAAHVDENGLVAIVWVAFAIATTFVFLRVAVRYRQNRYLMPDDYWMGFAWAATLTMAILQTEQMDALWFVTFMTSGRIPPTDPAVVHQVQQLTRWQFPVIKLFWTTLWAVKASFLALFYRLVKPFVVLRRLWYAVCVFAVIAYIGCWLSSALTCDPPSDYFKAGACSSPREIWRQRFNVLYSTSVDVASDLMIMALPLAVLPSLQLDKKKKIGLAVAFSLGIIIIAVAVVRMTQVIVGETVDLVGLAIWGAVETATAIVVGSLPPLQGLFIRSVIRHTTKRTGDKYKVGKMSNDKMNGYSPPHHLHPSNAKSVMVSESFPLSDMHRASQVNGGIYVQRTYETHVEPDSASRSDDEAAIVKHGHVPGDRMV